MIHELHECIHSRMAERASPCPLVLGSGRKVSLAISADPPRPFSGTRQREMGLHIFVDADLSTPKARAPDADPTIEVPSIASGRDPMVATADANSVSGIRMYLGGVEFVNSSLRQHLTSPDPHTSEVGHGRNDHHHGASSRWLIV